MALIDFYEAMLTSPHLVGVAQSFGNLATLGEDASPIIEWHLAPDDFNAKDTTPRRANLVIQGVPSQAKSLATRTAGCDLHLAVAATGDTRCYREMEELIRRTMVALHDTARSWDNLELRGGRPIDREAVSDGQIGYVLSIGVKVPIWTSLQTATLQDVEVTPADPTSP